MRKLLALNRGEIAIRILRAANELGIRTVAIYAQDQLELTSRLSDALGAADTVVVDCLTLWVSNLMLRGDDEAAILKEADALAVLVADPAAELRLVSNEVGFGVHPATVDGLRFRDVLGLVNQRVAAAASRVVLMVAGLPHLIKDTPLGIRSGALETS